jgi:hypothetical protein
MIGKCIKPTKTLTLDMTYDLVGVCKGREDGSYNGQWTRQWEVCEHKIATSYRVKDDVGIIRYISRKRFAVI